MDELAEFPRGNLDTLRQPLEDGVVSVARRGSTVEFPSSFHLVAATNPCPCGFYGDRRKPCECGPALLSRYRQRVSGPLLDRLDLVVKVRRVEAGEMLGPPPESTAVVRQRVSEALRFREQRPDQIGQDARRLILQALQTSMVTARGAGRLRRVARTIADLDQQETVGEDHVAEAMALRVEW